MSVSWGIDTDLSFIVSIWGAMNVDLTVTGPDGDFGSISLDLAGFVGFMFMRRQFIFNWCHWVDFIRFHFRLGDKLLELTVLKGLNVIDHHPRRRLRYFMLLNFIWFVILFGSLVKVFIGNFLLIVLVLRLKSIFWILINWAILISWILSTIEWNSFFWFNFVFLWFFAIWYYRMWNFRTLWLRIRVHKSSLRLYFA